MFIDSIFIKTFIIWKFSHLFGKKIKVKARGVGIMQAPHKPRAFKN